MLCVLGHKLSTRRHLIQSHTHTYIHVAAVPAHHLRRPVRLCMDRDEDMQVSALHSFFGLARTVCIHSTVYDCIFGDFPAKNTINL
jgi:hypothetical protein